MILFSLVVIFFTNNSLISQDETIAGKVKYGNEILQAATVSLEDKIILTDHRGEFSFSVKPGSYTITITHAGYKKKEESIALKPWRHKLC